MRGSRTASINPELPSARSSSDSKTSEARSSSSGSGGTTGSWKSSLAAAARRKPRKKILPKLAICTNASTRDRQGERERERETYTEQCVSRLYRVPECFGDRFSHGFVRFTIPRGGSKTTPAQSRGPEVHFVNIQGPFMACEANQGVLWSSWDPGTCVRELLLISCPLFSCGRLMPSL